MSQINPLPDLDYLNSFLNRRGKKVKHNAEFQKMKLLRIIQKVMLEDPIQAQIAQAHIEFYYDDFSNGIKILKNVLKLTNGESLLAWDLLCDKYIQSGDYENFLITFQDYQNSRAVFDKKLYDYCTHVLRVYMFTEILNQHDFYRLEDRNAVKEVSENLLKLESMNISLEVYRVFLSKIYEVFYKSFSGGIEPLTNFFENEIVIRVNSTIDNAKDLIEMNNEYNNLIVHWYASANNEIKEQIEKVTVYFRCKELVNIIQAS